MIEIYFNYEKVQEYSTNKCSWINDRDSHILLEALEIILLFSKAVLVPSSHVAHEELGGWELAVVIVVLLLVIHLFSLVRLW